MRGLEGLVTQGGRKASRAGQIGGAHLQAGVHEVSGGQAVAGLDGRGGESHCEMGSKQELTVQMGCIVGRRSVSKQGQSHCGLSQKFKAQD